MYRSVVLGLMLTFAPAAAMAQQPCTTDARQVVNEIYRHLLERGADAGSTQWTQQLENGRTVRDVVRQVAKSQEHLSRFWRRESGEEIAFIRSVETMYRHILGRQADAEGARSWANRAANTPPAVIIDQFIDSAEYNERFGDWVAPGSGGVRYCGSGNQGSSTSNSTAAVDADTARFRGMDRNGDGVVTRNEWRGNARAFDIQDWDGDGVLSDDEIDPNGVGRGRGNANGNANNARRTQRFETMDVNGNDRIESREWDGNVTAFNRLDANNDNVLSRAEFLNTAGAGGNRGAAGGNRGAAGGNRGAAVGTSGNFVRVDGRTAWTDSGVTVRTGDTITFEANGSVRISGSRNDVATVVGTPNGRQAFDGPLPNQAAGALIARIGNSAPIFIGNRASLRATSNGRLYLGINEDFLDDNSGDFQVQVTVER